MFGSQHRRLSLLFVAWLPALPRNRFTRSVVDAPTRRLVPTFTNITSIPTPLYVETTMFALHHMQRITNWDHRSSYAFTNATSYLALVQLNCTESRPLQPNDLMTSFCSYRLISIHLSLMTHGEPFSFKSNISTALSISLSTFCIVISWNCSTLLETPSFQLTTSFHE